MPQFNSGVNSLKLRSAYPRAAGLTTGEVGTSTASPSAPNSPRANVAGNEVMRAAQVGVTGSPLLALAVMTIMLFALMFIAKRIGSEGATFASIKLSIYNIFVITLAAIIGLNFFKLVFTKLKVPGVSAAVLAA